MAPRGNSFLLYFDSCSRGVLCCILHMSLYLHRFIKLEAVNFGGDAPKVRPFFWTRSLAADIATPLRPPSY